MRFNDIFVSKEGRFSVGVEESSGVLYVSIPVSNGMVDYEEYYEVDRGIFEMCQSDMPAALEFVGQCQRRERDDLLIIKPGKSRGTAI